MYRPEGFNAESIIEDMVKDIPLQLPTFAELIEAGADAMLKGLKKEGTKVKDKESYCCPCQVCNNGEDCIATDTGYLVFVPEEEK